MPHSINLVKISKGIHGERRYIVSAGWWRKWLDFVNFDQDPREPMRAQASDKGKKPQSSGASVNEAKFRDELRQLKQ